MTAPKSKSVEKRWGLSVVFGALALILSVAEAMPTQNAYGAFTQEELLALPRTCLAQDGVSRRLNSPVVPEEERKRWYATLGSSFKHYHHYCWGLMYMRRGASDASKQEYNYRSASNNFQYVIRNATRDFPLLPEVHLRKGIALRFLGEDAAAATEFTNALKLKSDYTPAYAALVDLYIDLNDVDGAISVLETGLKHAPNSKMLADKKSRLEERASSR